MEHIGTLPETNDILLPTIIPLFGILSLPAEQEDCHFCLEKITKVYGIQTTVLWTLHSHRMLQDMGICIPSRVNSTLRLLQNRLSIRRHMLPLPTRIHQETHLHNVLPHKSSHRMLNRPHNSTLAANLRSFAGMRTAH